jgi:predicted nucleic acid-binding protein
VDASALVKLVLRERESAALASAIPVAAEVATSEVAVVELTRSVRVAGLEDELEQELIELFEGCTLVAVDSHVVRTAAALTSETLRPLDAIHLASALVVAPDVMYVYDRQLARAARALGMRVEAPGASHA